MAELNEELLSVMDSFDQMLEIVDGYRAKAQAHGYSEFASEQMALDLHKLIYVNLMNEKVVE